MLGCRVPGRADPSQKRGTLKAEKSQLKPSLRIAHMVWSVPTAATNSLLGTGRSISSTGKRLQSVATISILEDHPHNPDWRHRLALVKHDIHLAGRCAPGCSTCMHQPRPLEPRSQPSLSLDEPHSPLWFHARAFFLP